MNDRKDTRIPQKSATAILNLFLIFAFNGCISSSNEDSNNRSLDSLEKEKSEVHVYSNNHRFEGTYLNEKRSGAGKYYYSEIEHFEGNYEDDLREGNGIYYHANGDKFEGMYQSGKRNGPGKYTFADKNILEGNWIDNQLEGKATIKNPRGKIIQEGYWKNNKYIGMENPDGFN